MSPFRINGIQANMGILKLNLDDQVSESPAAGGKFAQSQIESLEKYERYLLAIARDEMRSGLNRKFGPSDIVQQTFQQAVGKLSSFNGSNEQQFRGWLRKILINQMRQNERDLYRAKRDVRLERSFATDNDSAARSTSEPTDRWPTPSTDAVASEEDRQLHRCLTALPIHYQTVIRLRNWERCSFAEIGLQMEQSTDSVKKLWYRAILRLQKDMGLND